MHFLHSTDAHIRRGLIRGKLSKVIPYTPSDKTGSTRPVVLRRNEFNYYLSNRSRRVRWTHYGRWKTAIARVAYTNHATCIDFENFRVGKNNFTAGKVTIETIPLLSFASARTKHHATNNKTIGLEELKMWGRTVGFH
jgi:hypothetical protein